jgi:hypothetical protein
VLGQLQSAGRFRQSEVDDLGDRLAVLRFDEDVGRLEVAVDDALLVGVLDRATDLRFSRRVDAAGPLE